MSRILARTDVLPVDLAPCVRRRYAGTVNTTAARRLGLVLLTLAVLAGCWLAPAVDRTANEQVSTGLKRALTVFAAARALGAVISVAQGTQVAITPGGLGVSTAPGQALQPLNELVDQFAAVMLMASVSLGMQLLLLKIGAHWLVSAVLSAAVLVWLVLRWNGEGAAGRWFRPLLVLLLLARFAVPLSAMANEAVYRVFMQDEYQAQLAFIAESPAKVMGATVDGTPAADEGWRERIERWWKGRPDLKKVYDEIAKAASGWSESIVKLIALFILQTVVLPLVFLWLAWRLALAFAGGIAPRALAH